MVIERIALGKGVYLNIVETDKFKENYASVNFLNKLGPNAANNALLAKVLRRGSGKYPTMAEINRALDMLYSARVNAYVDRMGEAQVLSFYSIMLDNKYAPDGTDIFGGAMALAADLLRNPRTENGGFVREYTEGERANLKDDIAALINDKSNYAVRRCNEIMCSGEPYALSEIGTAEAADAITPESLYGHYNHALSSYPAEAYYIGRVKDAKQAIIDRFSDMFAQLERGSLEDYTTEIAGHAPFRGEFTEEMPVAQGKLTLGFRTGVTVKDSDYAKFALFNTLYGGSVTSRLFMNVREKLSLCYYCQSIPDAVKGVMLVRSGIEVENKQKAQDEIIAQLDDIKAGNISADEIADAKRAIVNAYREINDSPGAIQTWYLRRNICGVPMSPEEVAAEVEKVDADGICEAANKVGLDTVYFLKGTLNTEGGQQ